MGQVKKLAKGLLPDPMVEFTVAVLEHKRRHGYFPRLTNPRTFSEKIAYRKALDRRPLLTQFADKYAVREYIAAKLGPDFLPELYYVTKNPSDIPFDTLPSRFAVKPTHGSGWLRLVTDKSELDKAELIKTCESWLAESYYERGREWVYKNVEPQIIIEEFLDDGTGQVPNDYKFFVFDGHVKLIQVDVGRFTEHKRAFYDREWNPVDVRLSFPSVDGGLSPPVRLAELIRAAETLCNDIDFVRADFYSTARKIYFGELTNTPGSGLETFDPVSFDTYLGGFWTLPKRRQ